MLLQRPEVRDRETEEIRTQLSHIEACARPLATHPALVHGSPDTALSTRVAACHETTAALGPSLPPPSVRCRELSCSLLAASISPPEPDQPSTRA